MHPIIIMTPHPDDEILACTSWLTQAAKDKQAVKLVYFTDGEQDLVGELLSYCTQHMCMTADVFVGTATKLVPFNGSFQFITAVLITDKQGVPMSGVSIEAETEGSWDTVRTNALGYIILDRKKRITALYVNSVKIVLHSVPASFHSIFAEMRFQESMRALKQLNLCADIERLQLKDGSLAYLASDRRQQLTEHLRKILADAPNATVLYPHENDVDSDHRSISNIISTIRTSEHIFLRYVVHRSFDHKAWPDPPYKSTRSERCVSGKMSAPYETIQFIEKKTDQELKRKLLDCFATQLRSDEYGFLIAFAKENEFFYPFTLN